MLRAFAVLGVLALHLVPSAENAGVDFPWAENGELGVDLFFVLSGYFIGFSVLSPRRFDGADYARRRAFRILPAYWFSMIVVIGLLKADTLMTKSGLADTAAHILLIHGFFREFRVSINSVWWTLTIEWFFYIFMLLIAVVWRKRIGGYVVVAAMVVGCLLYRSVVWETVGGQPPDANFWLKQLPGTADLFAAGMLVALLVQSPRIREVVATGWVKSVGLVSGLLILVASIWQYDQHPSPDYYNHYFQVVWWPLTFAVGSALIVLFIQQFEHSIGRVARYTGLAFIGTISYSVYLFHTLFIGAFNRGWNQAQPDVSPWIILAMTLAVTLLFSTISYLFIERPFLTMSHRSKGARRGGFGHRPPEAGAPVDGRPTEAVGVAD